MDGAMIRCPSRANDARVMCMRTSLSFSQWWDWSWNGHGWSENGDGWENGKQAGAPRALESVSTFELRTHRGQIGIWML